MKASRMVEAAGRCPAARAIGYSRGLHISVSDIAVREGWQRSSRATSPPVTPVPSHVRGVHLPHADLPLTQRNAQLVIAREYGYAGWQDLTAEVSKRFARGLEWAATQARRVIHDNDVERLKQLLAEYPALLCWQGHDWDSKGGPAGNRHGRLWRRG